MGVSLSKDAFDTCGEPESVDVRLRLAGRASSTSDGASSSCATSFSEPQWLPELALDGPVGLPWLDVPFAPRRVVIWNGIEGARRDILPGTPSVPGPVRLLDAALCRIASAKSIHISAVWGQRRAPWLVEGYIRGLSNVSDTPLIVVIFRLGGMALSMRPGPEERQSTKAKGNAADGPNAHSAIKQLPCTYKICSVLGRLVDSASFLKLTEADMVL